MTAKQILKAKKINIDQSILQIDAEEAFSNLIEAKKEFCSSLKLSRLSKKEIEKLLDDYGDMVVNYHPENYHQERATFLKNEKMLRKYGLTDEDITILDFC